MSQRPYAGLAPGFALGLLLLGFSAFSLFVSAAYGQGPEPPPVRAADVPVADRGRLTLVDAKVPVIRVAGTPYEMGRQHGVILKKQIHFLYREYYQALIVRSVGAKELAAWAAAVEQHIPEAYREEMRGLSEGSGLPFDEVLRFNTMVDRFQTVLCSTVVASGDATRDGDVYFGRNLDFVGRGLLQKMTVVLVWHPDKGTPLASITWPGLIGVLSGMNGHGVCGATMMISHAGKAKPGMPYMMMYRAALAGARKTTDVHDSIAKAKRTCANNFMVVDATGAAEVIEFSPDLVRRRSPEDGYLCSTNFFHSADLADVGVPLGKERYETLAQFAKESHGSIDAKGVQGALAAVGKRFMTVQSMVFLPRRRALHLACGPEMPASGQPYVYLAPEVLFGAKK